MSKPELKLALSATVLFLIATSVLYMVSLPHSLRTLRDHFENARANSRAHKEYLWESSQISHAFSNDQYHITSDSDWALLFPTNDGRIPSPINPDEEVMLSMHHQLHCLNIIRIAYLALHTTPSTMPPVDYADVDMCLEQLRQHIMCNCDLTLEPTVLVRMKGTGVIAPGSNGIGVEHRCLNWEKLSAEIDTMPVIARTRNL
jgi:hypothetical protein